MAYLKCLRNASASSIPDGKTVTPTDDISIWLACGGRSETYTTLAEVLNDSVCLSTLIADSNAVDYLVRSTSFAKSEALVPAMTDNTHPSGEAFASVSYSTNLPYKAFDNDTSTYWDTASNSNEYVGYTFTSAKIVTGISLLPDFTGASTYNRVKNFKVQGSNDGFVSDINDLYEGTAESTNSPTVQRFNFANSTAYTSYRLFVIDAYSTANIGVISLQFYNVAEGICDNASAMSYIGLNNYASNTLLADSTWCSAIFGSTYKESVLNVKAPAMTSNNTPSGYIASALTEVQSAEAYCAFNGNDSDYWAPSNTNLPTWVQIKFPSNVDIYGFGLKATNANRVPSSYSISDSTNGSDFTTLYSDNSQPQSVMDKLQTFSEKATAQYFRMTISAVHQYIGVFELQFYGRADI